MNRKKYIKHLKTRRRHWKSLLNAVKKDDNYNFLNYATGRIDLLDDLIKELKEK